MASSSSSTTVSITIKVFTTLVLVNYFLTTCYYVNAGGCKKAEAIQVNETWYLKQSEEGWYGCHTKEMSKDELAATATSAGKSETLGSNNVCFIDSMVTYKCNYKYLNDMMCLYGTSIFPTPKFFRSTIVSTDGNSYVAFMSCISGEVDAYFVLCKNKEPLSKETKANIMKALQMKDGETMSDFSLAPDVKVKITKECKGVVGGLPGAVSAPKEVPKAPAADVPDVGGGLGK